MKTTFLICCFLIGALNGFAQSKAEKALIERTYLLSHTVFGSKDSLILEDLFAKKSSYGHSGGKVETREEAVQNISKNKSIYKDTAVSNITVVINDDVAIVRHLFKANENKVDGTVTPLNFTMMLVWVKEKGKWRLAGRQAVKLS
ncbi:MAG: nuclear transport factor 2 family protein [Chitinophagaceae bacterium]|nr:MAG: nuclear transport factor 2 family protein [Chitinophagaceae bacterium]